MLEFVAYAALLLGLPFLAPLWIGVKVFQIVKRLSNQGAFAAIVALVFVALSFLVLGYIGFFSALFLGCYLNPFDPECEYIAWDTVFGAP